MNFVGNWRFHSFGMLNENDELIYLNAEEYLQAPMPYIDEEDPDAAKDELQERKQIIGSRLKICENGELYMLMPIPEDVPKEELDEAIAAGYFKLYDGMLTNDAMHWEERDGQFWLEVGEGMSEDGWAQLSNGEFLNFMTTRYTKAD